MKGLGREHMTLLVSIALHGSGAGYAAYTGGPLLVRGDDLVRVEAVELAPTVPPEPTAKCERAPGPNTEPPRRPEPRRIEPRTAAARPPPALPPRALGVPTSETSQAVEPPVAAGESAAVNPRVRGDAHGAEGGAPGGTRTGYPGGIASAPVAARSLPVIAPSYGAGYLHNAPPRYPAVARRLRLQGTATVRALVGTDGRPQRVRLAISSGVEVLDDAALEAVQRWTFVP